MEFYVSRILILKYLKIFQGRSSRHSQVPNLEKAFW